MRKGGLADAEILIQGKWTVKVIARGARRPAVEFMERLPQSERRKTRAFLARTAEVGPLEQRSRPLRGKIFELKPTAQVRLLYFLDGWRSLVITNGFVKKQQRTPKEEIIRAEALRAEFLEG